MDSSRQVGTPFYLAPELLSEAGKYSPKSDVWAVGVILYELICLKYPFQGKDFDDLKIKIVNEPFQPIKSFGNKVSTDLIELCNKMLSKDPIDRPLMADIFKLKWIR